MYVFLYFSVFTFGENYGTIRASKFARRIKEVEKWNLKVNSKSKC